MNMSHKLLLMTASALSVASIGSTAQADLLLDDFSSDTLSPEYTASVVASFDAGQIEYEFETTSNDNRLTMTSNSLPVGNQVVLLRDDVSLDVGETLIVDLVSTTGVRDLNGLVIFDSEAPSDRNGSIAIGFFDTPNDLRSWYFTDDGFLRPGTHDTTGTVVSYFIEYARRIEFNGAVSAHQFNLG